MLLAAASLYVLDPHDVAGPLNAAIFGLTIFAVGHCLRRYLRHSFLAVGAGLAAMLSIPLASLAAAAITEPLFIRLLTLALAQTARFLDGGSGRSAITRTVLLPQYSPGLPGPYIYTPTTRAIALFPNLYRMRCRI